MLRRALFLPFHHQILRLLPCRYSCLRLFLCLHLLLVLSAYPHLQLRALLKFVII